MCVSPSFCDFETAHRAYPTTSTLARRDARIEEGTDCHVSYSERTRPYALDHLRYPTIVRAGPNKTDTTTATSGVSRNIESTTKGNFHYRHLLSSTMRLLYSTTRLLSSPSATLGIVAPDDPRTWRRRIRRYSTLASASSYCSHRVRPHPVKRQ